MISVGGVDFAINDDRPLCNKFGYQVSGLRLRQADSARQKQERVTARVRFLPIAG